MQSESLSEVRQISTAGKGQDVGIELVEHILVDKT